MMNKRILFYTGCLVLIGINFFSCFAAEEAKACRVIWLKPFRLLPPARDPRLPEARPVRGPTIYTFDRNLNPTVLSNYFRASFSLPRRNYIEFNGSRRSSAAELYEQYIEQYNKAARQRFTRDLTCEEKHDLLKDIVRAKFRRDPYQTALLETGDAPILDGSEREKTGNTYRPTTMTNIGQILMEVRDELRGRAYAVPVRTQRETVYKAGPPLDPVQGEAAERFAPQSAQALIPISQERPPIQAVPARIIQPPAAVPTTIVPPKPVEQPFALYAAIRAGDTVSVTRLIGQGENINISDSQGDSPLHLAADIGNLEIVKMLLEKDADVLARDANKHTPFLRAQLAGNFQVADYLGNWKIPCPICLEKFRSIDLPAVGPCGHRICAKDLNLLYEREGDNVLCPICRGPVYLQPVAPE